MLVNSVHQPITNILFTSQIWIQVVRPSLHPEKLNYYFLIEDIDCAFPSRDDGDDASVGALVIQE